MQMLMIGVVRDMSENDFEIIVRGEEISSDLDWRAYWKTSAEPGVATGV